MELHGNKIEYQENQSFRVFSIPESAGETWESAETKVKDAIKEKLNIEVDIERAHRVERRKSGGINQHQAGAKPRLCIPLLQENPLGKKVSFRDTREHCKIAMDLRLEGYDWSILSSLVDLDESVELLSQKL